jgi:hypothetical protein
MSFVEVFIRQAHPGPGARPYQLMSDKVDDATRYELEERIPWPVLVDDLAGTVHQAYGGLPDPTYIIDADGRIAFYNFFTHAPTLHRVLVALAEQGNRGTVLGGLDRTPHGAAAVTDGWRGLRRGKPRSVIDLETTLPLSGATVWLGHQLRPVLAPLALRAEPLPRPVRIGILATAAALAVGLIVLGRRAASG